jgi:hypothetical protein
MNGMRGLCAIRGRCRQSEDGAILLFAVILMIVVALLLGALVTFSGSDIMNTANFQQARKVEYAGDGAVDAAIQAVRFTCYAFNGTESKDTCPSAPQDDCLPDGVVFVHPDENTQVMTFYATTSRRISLKVRCVGTLSGDTRTTRVITFLACNASRSTCTATTAIVKATVAFQDYEAGSVYRVPGPGMLGRPNTCSSPENSSSCGFGIVVKSWTVSGSRS